MVADMHWVGHWRMQTMQLVQNGSSISPSQVNAGNPMNRSWTGVGLETLFQRVPVPGYSRVTGCLSPLTVETKVTHNPLRLFSIGRRASCRIIGFRQERPLSSLDLLPRPYLRHQVGRSDHPPVDQVSHHHQPGR